MYNREWLRGYTAFVQNFPQTREKEKSMIPLYVRNPDLLLESWESITADYSAGWCDARLDAFGC